MLLLLLSCAPMYRPHPVHSPMLEAPGDVHVAGAVELEGGQLAAAWAADDHLGLRADVQVDGMSGPYGLATVGVGWFHAGAEGLRVGLWLDAGGGYATSSNTATINKVTSEYHLAGALAQGTASAELGWEGDSVAAGLELRSVTQVLWHDAGSDETGTGWLNSAELLGLMRTGRAPWRFLAFAGISLPVAGDGTTGVQLPILFGLGMSWDLTGAPMSATTH